jgi:tetratricopeptide (TPR) repeat protein
MSLYQQHILLNNEQTPITSSMCSLQGHEIMAGMLNQAKNYSQAAKHYEVLLEMLQDQNFEKDKGSPNELEVKNIQSELGVCYVRTGMRKEAIKLYRKSYELQPDNYFLMTNMCALLIDEDQKEEANSYYQGYLASKGADQMEDKVEFVDCLLNICICQRETDGEEEAIERALSAIATYFPSTDDVRDKLNELSVVDVYLRKADLLEYKCQHSSPEQKKHSKEELLDLYLACLQFDSCPDR